MSDSLQPHDCTFHGILQARILEWVPITSLVDLPNPGIKPRSFTLQADSLPAEPQGKPQNTGMSSLSLLQWIFSTQESNQGLLCCRQVLSNWAIKEALGTKNTRQIPIDMCYKVSDLLKIVKVIETRKVWWSVTVWRILRRHDSQM